MSEITITTNEKYNISADITAQNWQQVHEAALMGLGDAKADSRYGHTHIGYDPELGYHFVHLVR